MLDPTSYIVRIDRSEVLRYLGYGGAAPDPAVQKQLEEAAGTIQAIARPAVVYRAFPLEHRDDGVRLAGTALTLPGRTAETMLANCTRCILLAATIGRAVDGALRRRQVRDMAGAVILDSTASNAVENLCEQLNRDLEAEYEAQGLYLTDRFSPGYGDLPLSLQPAVLRTLAAEKTIGLSVTSGLLLMPTKSVTACIGIADAPQPRRITGCRYCRLRKSCPYRKTGAYCSTEAG